MPKKNSEIKDNSEDKSKKIFDVSSPGKTEADATSRPVIVGSGSMIKKDPMVTGDAVDESDSLPRPVIKKSISLKPLSDSDLNKPEENEKNEETKTPEEPEALSVEPKTEETENNTPEESINQINDQEIPNTENNEKEEEVKVDDTADQAQDVEQDDEAQEAEQTDQAQEAEQKDQEKNPEETARQENSQPDGAENGSVVANELAGKLNEKKEEKEKQEKRAKEIEEINKLVESKKYFVKVYQGPGGTSYRTWIILLLFVFFAVGVYLCMKAGLLDFNFQLPSNLF